MNMSKIDIFIFVDALGYEILNLHPTFLKSFKHRKPVEMQFGYSSTALPTILTGERPDKHNHFSFFYYDPCSSPFKKSLTISLCKLLPEKIQYWWRFRIYLSKLMKKLLGYSGYFQLYNINLKDVGVINYCEKEDIFSNNAFKGIDNLKDILDRSDKEYFITPWQNPEDLNHELAMKQIEDKSIDFLFMYKAKLDSVLHNNEIQSSEVEKLLKKYEYQITELYNLAKDNYEDFNITIISDHGMTPFTEKINLKKSLEELDVTLKEDYFAIYDSTMLRLWYFNKKSEKLIKDLLKTKFKEYGHILSYDEKCKGGINFKNSKYGEDIFLVKPGVQIVPSDMGKKELRGMHGYHPSDKYSNAAIMSLTPIPEYIKHVSDFFKLFKECLS
jgi:predicted AlkP superfamily pyrophosphatase or phosphodiesterase